MGDKLISIWLGVGLKTQNTEELRMDVISEVPSFLLTYDVVCGWSPQSINITCVYQHITTSGGVCLVVL